MPNYPALSTFLQSVTVRPGLIVPHLVVPTPAFISWRRAQALGVRSVIFDKDNCLTSPNSDKLAPLLRDSYADCLRTFGKGNVLIVSNSVGCSGDTVGAQVLSKELDGTTVLCHSQKKPGRRVAREVIEYLHAEARAEEGGTSAAIRPKSLLQRIFMRLKATQASQSLGHVLVIGDRITTDTVLGHRIQDCLDKRRQEVGALDGTSPQPDQAITVLTTHLWATEGSSNRLMRRMEAFMRDFYGRCGIAPGQKGWQKTLAPAELDTDPRTKNRTWQEIVIQEASIKTEFNPPIQPPAALSDPTAALFLSSEIRRSQWLPPVVQRVLLGVLSSRALARIAVFFRDGWLLILKGCGEGLNGFGAPYQRRSGAFPAVGGQHSIFSSASTATGIHGRSSPRSAGVYNADGRRWCSSSLPRRHPHIPTIYKISSVAAVALVPICFLLGSGIHEATHQDPSIEQDVCKYELESDDADAVRRREAASVRAKAMRIEEERKIRHSELEKLERRRHELEWSLRDVEDKLVVVQARLARQRQRQQKATQ